MTTKKGRGHKGSSGGIKAPEDALAATVGNPENQSPSGQSEYQVKRAFSYEGTYYTRGNQHLIADALPKDAIEARVESGSIVKTQSKGD